jgi:hypothetical protein
MKLCECGCGETAPLAKRTVNRIGQLKGQPMRFICGHQQRNRPTKSRRFTFVDGILKQAHIRRAEAALGKLLPRGAVVHHHNKAAFDNDSPLVICENQAYHMLLHYRTRIVRAGGNPNTDKICGACKKPKSLGLFPLDRSRLQGRGSSCRECVDIRQPAKNVRTQALKAERKAARGTHETA